MTAALFSAVGPTSPAGATPAPQTVAQANPAPGDPVAVIYTLGQAPKDKGKGKGKGSKKYHVHNGTFLGYLFGANTTIGVRIKHVKSWPNSKTVPDAEELDVCYPSTSHINGCQKSTDKKTGQLVQWQFYDLKVYSGTAIVYKNATGNDTRPHNGAFVSFTCTNPKSCSSNLPISEQQGILQIAHYASIKPVKGKNGKPKARWALDPNDFQLLTSAIGPGKISAQKMSDISVKK